MKIKQVFEKWGFHNSTELWLGNLLMQIPLHSLVILHFKTSQYFTWYVTHMYPTPFYPNYLVEVLFWTTYIHLYLVFLPFNFLNEIWAYYLSLFNPTYLVAVFAIYREKIQFVSNLICRNSRSHLKAYFRSKRKLECYTLGSYSNST